MPGRLDPSLAQPAVRVPSPEIVPAAVRQAALEVFDLRLRGAVILDLIFDSAVDECAAEAGVRRLRFDARPSGVDVQIEVVLNALLPEVTRVQVWPARSVTVELRSPEGSERFPTSTDGLAVTCLRPRGLVCFVLRSGDPDERLLQSAWVRA